MRKYNVEIIVAHNGVEVITATETTHHIHTEIDDIISDWREQERKRRKPADPIITDLFKKIKRWCA